MVDAIWTEMGLLFPPKVEPLPRQARSMVADATRLSIRLADASPSWWLLHELAHAMTSADDGRSDGHGPKFIGLYAQLLTRYLRIPSDALLTSLRVAGIEMDMRAVPIFIDSPQGCEPPPVDPHFASSRGRRQTKRTVIASSFDRMKPRATCLLLPAHLLELCNPAEHLLSWSCHASRRAAGSAMRFPRIAAGWDDGADCDGLRRL